MSKENNIEVKYKRLVSEITDLDYHYYTLDNPKVSDKLYDEKYNELERIEREHPDLASKNSPTQKVGGELLEGSTKKEHTYQLYSLDKSQNESEVEKFVDDVKKVLGDKTKFSLEWKLDGLAFVARYENGEFVEARTRGNGLIGELITGQVKTIRNLPLQIPYKNTVEVQGEIIIPLDMFEKYNKKMEEKLSEISKTDDYVGRENFYAEKFRVFNNPRNAASGSIRQLNTSVVAERPLSAIMYDVGYIEGKDMKSQEEINKFFSDNKFEGAPYLKVLDSLGNIKSELKKLTEVRPDLNFEVDGIVIKVNDVESRSKLGYTSKFPKWATAFKFEATEEQTKIIDVEWEVGRTGRITPVAILQPVFFDGVQVTRATLNNLENIELKKLSLGVEVFIRRSNDVIPEIMGVVPGSTGEEIKKPNQCPSCGEETVVEMPFLWCKNDFTCPAQNIRKWKHFCSRDGMNIIGLSDKTLSLLLSENIVEKISDLFALEAEDLEGLERFGPKRIENLINSINNSKNVNWRNFFYSLGIENASSGTAERISKVYPDYNSFKGVTFEDLIKIDDIGNVVGEEIIKYFSDERNVSEIERMIELGVNIIPEKKKENAGNKQYEGKSFVLTGTMTKPRREVKAAIEAMGGKVRSSVTKNTDYLIHGESAGSKLTRALELGIKVFTEDEFDFGN